MKNFLLVLAVGWLSCCFAQQTQHVDFLKADAQLVINTDKAEVSGVVNYTFNVLKEDSLRIDKRTIDIKSFRINDKEWLINSEVFKDNQIKIPVNASNGNTLEISYTVKPKKALYFVKRNGETQIWTQGQGKYTSHWLPSFDDVNEKLEYDLSITTNTKYTVIANGKLIDKTTKDAYTTWHYDMQKPMSSYLVALAIGKYKKKTETSKSGIPLEFYYYPEDSLKVESTYRYSKQMFDFLEDEIGVAYPWQNYKQVPVHDFLYAGMENTSCTIFSDAFVVDDIGFNDKNYVNVNAHELAHQWFGNLVTAKSGEHHWLQEGFATYYALLAERGIFGDNYFYFKLYESAVDLGRQDISGSGTSLLNPKSSSLTFYQRGAWVLHALRTLVGDNVFKNAVVNYLEKHQFATVETSDFIKEVEKLYGKSLTTFVNVWVKQNTFPVDAAIGLLQNQSTFINEYLMVDCQAKSSKCNDYLRYYVSDEAKVKVISQRPELVTTDTFKHGFKVRQAISQYVTQIPKALKTDYETLLNDKSYITIENALYNLWSNFPEDRAKYLSKTRDIVGFNDKNVRLLWIVLNLNTPFYQADSKHGLYEELLAYTGATYNADLRIKAFQYLDLMKACDATCKSHLENAKTHHNWRLVKFAKEMSKKLENKN